MASVCHDKLINRGRYKQQFYLRPLITNGILKFTNK